MGFMLKSKVKISPGLPQFTVAPPSTQAQRKHASIAQISFLHETRRVCKFLPDPLQQEASLVKN